MTSEPNTTNAARTVQAPDVLPVPVSGTDLVQRYLWLALRNDYLSAGRGHRQSRRTVRERMLAADPTRAGTAPRTADTALSADPERRYLSEVARRPRLTSREEYGLAGRMRQGDRAAYDDLIGAHLGLVVMTARRYQRPGIPLLDLIAEGNFGLMRAAERFDREMGCRFSTYANWWIRQAIQRALPKLSSVVRRPLNHGHPTASSGSEVGAPASEPASETAADAPWPEPGPQEMDVPPPGAAEAEPRVAAAADHSHRSAAGDGLRGELDVSDIVDTLTIDPDDEPPAAALANQRLKALYGALAQLPERDRIIVTARYALDSDRPSTLDELSQQLGVSLERIRQLENAAVKKLGRLLMDAGQSAASLL